MHRPHPRSATIVVLCTVLPVLVTLASILSMAAASAADGRRPEPFVFMHGLQGSGAAETARDLGFNTVYLDLPLEGPLHLDEIRELIAEAEAENRRVIVGLPTKLGGDYLISARNPAYVEAVREWLEATVGSLAEHEEIDAWATDHFLERDISYTDGDFQAFLRERHGSIEAINRAWGSRVLRIEDITREKAREIDDDQTRGVGRASVDLADYEWRAFHDIMELWASEIRRLDPERTLISGRISLYRSLVAIPEAYDIVQPFMPPDTLEPDIVTHNVHAVQMARRGGRFDVIPWLRAPLPPSEAYAQGALYAWVLEAGLRGAIGVGIEDWSRVSERNWVKRNLMDQLNAAFAERPFKGDRPASTTAVIHAPYAGGHEFAATPAYGFITDYVVHNLATIAFNYRLGTIFGCIDYLRVDEIADTDLSRYSVILAPATLSVPPETASALVSYVEAGGSLFADLGFGMYEAGSWNPAANPLSALFGISGARDPKDRYGTFSVGETHPQFPSLRVGMRAEGSFVPGRGVSRSMGRVSQYSFEGDARMLKGYPFQSPSWYLRLGSGAFPLATQDVVYDDEQRPHFLGPIMSEVGAGLAVFAPFEAWSFWPPDEPLHAALHSDLMRRRARYRLMSNRLAEAAVGLSGSDDRLLLLGRQDTGTIQVLAGAAEHRAYLGATCTFSANERRLGGRRSGVVKLELALAAGEMRHCEAIPVTLRPETGEANARISAYGTGLIAMEIGGHGSVWGRERRDLPEAFHSGQATRVRIGVDDGLYPVEPGSAHEVMLTEGREQSEKMTVEADHRGKLDFWITVTGGRLSVTPAED